MARARRRLAALGLLSVVAVAVVSPPAETLASWSDPETASGTYSAMTLPAPGSMSCTTVGIPIVHLEARLNWTAPAGGLPQGTQYELQATNVTATPNIVTTARTTGTTYTFADGLLGSGLLLGLLSGTSTLRVQVFTVPTEPSSWRSAPVPSTPITVAYSGGLLAGNFTC